MKRAPRSLNRAISPSEGRSEISTADEPQDARNAKPSPLSSAFECPNLAFALSTLVRGMEAIAATGLRSRFERCGTRSSEARRFPA